MSTPVDDDSDPAVSLGMTTRILKKYYRITVASDISEGDIHRTNPQWTTFDVS